MLHCKRTSAHQSKYVIQHIQRLRSGFVNPDSSHLSMRENTVQATLCEPTNLMIWPLR